MNCEPLSVAPARILSLGLILRVSLVLLQVEYSVEECQSGLSGHHVLDIIVNADRGETYPEVGSE